MKSLFVEYNTLPKQELEEMEKQFEIGVSLFQLAKEEAEEELLKAVLADLLKREVTEDDIKRLTRIVLDTRHYHLEFDNVRIGTVRFTGGELKDRSFRPRFEFTPYPIHCETPTFPPGGITTGKPFELKGESKKEDVIEKLEDIYMNDPLKKAAKQKLESLDESVKNNPEKGLGFHLFGFESPDKPKQ